MDTDTKVSYIVNIKQIMYMRDLCWDLYLLPFNSGVKRVNTSISLSGQKTSE